MFSIPQGEKLFTFKRGIHTAQIYSLTFNIKSTYVVLSSNSGTIHVFRLGGESSDAHVPASAVAPPEYNI